MILDFYKLFKGTEKDLNEKDHKGQTPLMLATCSVHKGNKKL